MTGPTRTRLTVTTVNAPQAVKGTKARLLSWPARGRELARLLAFHGVTLAALQEAGPRWRRALRAAPHLALRLAPANTARGAWRVGNGTVHDPRILRVLHRRVLRVRRPGHRTPLRVPVTLYRVRITGERVVFVAGHADRKRPTPAANLAALEQIAALGPRLRAQGLPVVVGLDTNNAPAARRIFGQHGWTHLAGRGIDQIYGLGVTGTNARTLGGFTGRVTDHPDPPAVDISIDLINDTARRLAPINQEQP